MQELKRLLGAGLLALGLAGCGANYQTVDRRTDLGPNDSGRNVAIHLDAQQRLVLVTGLEYCAEASPDALAAYASTLGLGASVPSQGSASLAAAASNAASIGLRTQSITIMRDVLYRMCEASNNDDLNELEVAMFLRRSQDLAAVVLAIEQLTGAVSARQVAITPGGTADASANLTANEQLLEQASERVAAKETEVTQAQGAVTAAEQAVAEATDETREAAEADLADAQRTLAQKQEHLERAQEVEAAIESAFNVALTNAAAATTGGAEFAPPVVQPQPLSKEATEVVAENVRSMVTEVLKKDYTTDTCISFLASAPDADRATPGQKTLIDICQAALTEAAEKQFETFRASFGQDENSELIQGLLDAETISRADIGEWLGSVDRSDRFPQELFPQDLVDNKELADLRADFVQHLKDTGRID